MSSDIFRGILFFCEFFVNYYILQSLFWKSKLTAIHPENP